jgi:hypothetical protein
MAAQNIVKRYSLANAIFVERHSPVFGVVENTQTRNGFFTNAAVAYDPPNLLPLLICSDQLCTPDIPVHRVWCIPPES